MGEVTIRLNKYLSEAGYCSRRDADKLIEQGRVTLNKRTPEIGEKVKAGDEVRVDGQLIKGPDVKEHVYLALNKPPGIVCTTDSSEKNNIVDFVNYPRRIFPIGRLDKPSEGLIFMTSDGNIVNKILRAGNNHQKEYEVSVDKPINKEFLEGMSNGVPILGKMTKKCHVERQGPKAFKIILTQGMNRQIRRMCEHFGYKVTRLKRTRIMNIKLDLPPGHWRELTDSELSELKSLVKTSSKTHKSGKKGGTKNNAKQKSKAGFNPKSKAHRNKKSKFSRTSNQGGKGSKKRRK